MARANINVFNVHKENYKTTLSTELSNLEGAGVRFPDSPSMSLIVVGKSHEVTFVVSKVDRNREGELLAYELKPTRESLHRVPESAGTTVIIFND